MLKCNEIVELIASDKSLTFLGKMELKMHLLMCKHCNNYSKQIEIINNQYKKSIEKVTNTDEVHVQDLEDKVLESVKNKKEQKP
ncbi:MAG: hypothetical protein HOP07_07315 [Bacteriovoracaceae bacterium]|nr:hypothetical protein [Bacteriovoracaceae bacterium]